MCGDGLNRGTEERGKAEKVLPLSLFASLLDARLDEDWRRCKRSVT